jgi:tetratricopeptide (TPR) repeat protein
MRFGFLPASFRAWKERRQALQELDDIQNHEDWVLARSDTNLVHSAKIALSLGDKSAALDFWQQALVRYPRFARQSADAFEILLGLGLFDDAEALTHEFRRRSPKDPVYAGWFALVSERRGDTDEAIRRWASVRDKFPAYWMGFVHGAVCLRNSGQLAAAEALHKKSGELFPDILHMWMEWARTVEQKEDWPEAIRLWDVVSKRFRHFAGDVGVARGLEELGRPEEAEARLKEARYRSASEPQIAIALTRLACRRGAYDEALICCEEARARIPLHPFGYREGTRLLLELGRYSEAEAILLAAAKRFPQQVWPMVDYASLASRQNNWEAAVTRWEAVRAGWPDRQDGYLQGAQALAALGREEEAAQLRAERP